MSDVKSLNPVLGLSWEISGKESYNNNNNNNNKNNNSNSNNNNNNNNFNISHRFIDI